MITVVIFQQLHLKSLTVKLYAVVKDFNNLYQPLLIRNNSV